MRVQNITSKTIAVQKFLADIFIGIGSVVLILKFISCCLGFKLLPEYGSTAMAFFIGVLVYGFGMYTLAIVLESYLDLKKQIEARINVTRAAE